MTLENVIEHAAAVGYDALDITGYYFPNYPAVPSDEYINQIKLKAFRCGVTICGTGVKNDFALADPAAREKEKQLVKAWTIVAAKLGANTLRVFSGLKTPEGYTWEQTAQWIAADLDECAEFAKQHGVILALQNHDDFLKTANETENLFSRCKSDNIGLMLDIGSFRKGNPYAEIEQAIPYAISWQIKENVYVDGKETPADFNRIMQLINKYGYCGVVPIEILGSGNEKERSKRMVDQVKAAIVKQ